MDFQKSSESIHPLAIIGHEFTVLIVKFKIYWSSYRVWQNHCTAIFGMTDILFRRRQPNRTHWFTPENGVPRCSHAAAVMLCCRLVSIHCRALWNNPHYVSRVSVNNPGIPYHILIIVIIGISIILHTVFTMLWIKKKLDPRLYQHSLVSKDGGTRCYIIWTVWWFLSHSTDMCGGLRNYNIKVNYTDGPEMICTLTQPVHTPN